jgi:serine/threonine-protein kinase
MTTDSGGLLNGRYRIEERLAAGGMGAVYRAFDTLQDERCAVKRFRLEYLPTEEETHRREDEDATRLRYQRKTRPVTREKAIEMFKGEARLLARLEHPNLPKVTDFFAVENSYYLVMTLIEGMTLAALLEEADGSPIPEDQVMDWMSQVMDALCYCHAQGVVHRDVKPQNVMLIPPGKAYLVDFGIAKPKPADETLIPSYARGYSPPEQYTTDENTDARSDVYALGATMYVLLTGQRPLEAPVRATGKKLASPRSLVAGISPAVDSVVVKAMEMDPSDRFQSVVAMRESLKDQFINHKLAPPSWILLILLVLGIAPVALCGGAGLWWQLWGREAGSPTAAPTIAAASSEGSQVTASTPIPALASVSTPTAMPGPLTETSVPSAKTPVSATETPLHPTKPPAPPTSTPVPPTNTPRPPAPTTTPTPTDTSTATPTPTNTPRPLKSLPARPTCGVSVYSEFQTLRRVDWNVLGCPSAVASRGVWIAKENFESGQMLWREDSREIYVCYNSGRWARFLDTWYEGSPEFSCPELGTQSPPVPKRGFGKVWCQDRSVRDDLGWAVDEESGFHGTLQDFTSGGGIIQVDTGGVLVFYPMGTWIEH